MERMHYVETDDKLVIETLYDPSEIIEENAEVRARGGVKLGSKGQELVLAIRIPVEHIEALKNEGYNLLSPDPAESHRALLYIQQHQHKFMCTDKKIIADRKQRWV